MISTMRRMFTRTITGCVVALVALLGASTAAMAATPVHAAPTAVGNCTTNFYFLHTSNNQYLDVKGAGHAGTVVDAWYYNGGGNQAWCFQKNTTDNDGQSGGYYLHPENENGNECLDASNFPDLYVLTCNGTTQQVFDTNPGISGWITSRYMEWQFGETQGISPNGFGKDVTLTNGNGWVWYPQS